MVKSTDMNKMSHLFRYILTCSFIIFFVILVSGQDEVVMKKSRLSADLTQYHDHFVLSVSLSAKKTGVKGRDYIKDQLIQVLQSNDSTDLVIAEATTAANGKVDIRINKTDELLSNEDGFIVFEAIYEGNDSLRGASSEIEVKKAFLNLAFFEEDSLKMIRFNAAEFDVNGEEIPFDELDVVVYTKGLFSLLKIGTAWMEEGEAIMPFPTDLPGDTLGNLFFTARIEDSDDHGIVETKGSIDWAPPKEISKEINRGLGDTDAPLWMVYTLIILLSVVWIHYLYIIFSFYLIKKEGEKSNTV